MNGGSDQRVGALIAVPLAGLLVLIAFMMGLAIATGGAGAGACGGGGEESTGTLKSGVPQKLVPVFQAAAAKYRLGPKGPAMLASINFNETAFGTNMNNTTGSGAMGWMMFMPATWAEYGVDANGDGKKDPYDPEDAIYAAAGYLKASGAPGNWHDAIFAYNHAEWYVDRILEDFRTFDGGGMESVAPGGAEEACEVELGGEAMLHHAQRLFHPRAFKALPKQLMAEGRAPAEVDVRIWADAVWFLEHYGLRVREARAAGHNTHGDGTAMDMVPAPGRGWDGTAKRAAEDLGWTEPCAEYGVRPGCPLVPAIHFVGYNGYDSLHGDPQHSESPHLHVSWDSSDYGGCPLVLCGPNEWVMAFPLR